MDKLAQQNSELQLKEEEARVKENEMISKVKRKTEMAIERERQKRIKDQQFQKQLEETLQAADFSHVFTRYHKNLEHMFKFFCLQARADLSQTPQQRHSNMHLQEFTKFGAWTRVVPVFLPPDDMITLFRTIEKWQATSQQAAYLRRSGQDAPQGTITFLSFQNALGRLTILANQSSIDESTYTSQDSTRRVREIMSKREDQRQQVEKQVLTEMRAEFDHK